VMTCVKFVRSIDGQHAAGSQSASKYNEGVSLPGIASAITRAPAVLALQLGPGQVSTVLAHGPIHQGCTV
jgi:hypothetical protein